MPRSTYAELVSESLEQHAPGYLARPTAAADGRTIDLSKGEVQVPWAAEHLSCLAAVDGSLMAYQSPLGLPQLRQEFLTFTAIKSLSMDNVMITYGAKQAIWFALAATLRPKDKVLVPFPGWSPYRTWVSMFGGQSVTYNAIDTTASELLDRISRGDARLAVINSPHNPTGVELQQSVIDAIASAAIESGTTIISDEVYRAFSVGGGSFARHLASEQIILADSISKSCAAAGLRIGFLAAAKSVISRALALRSVSDSCPPGITQVAAARLIASELAPFRDRIRAFVRSSVNGLHREVVRSGLAGVSSGALYVWVKKPSGLRSSHLSIGEQLLGACDGSSFGEPNFVRLCPAVEDRWIEYLSGRSQGGAS